ncbi:MULTISPECIES: hypothetical protein [unclassified Serratia (in: enterobacteria)]|uniref:hypothetical protein n=1 Tax=unclassified Serratia (in: enterobacteria) TaxID=2647522 RepID=UPI0030767508
MKLSPFLKVLVLTPVLIVTGCDSVMKAEFRTLSDCLSSIENNSGHSLTVIRDKPDIVSGKLSNGKTFACELKETGTKGTYYEGWYKAD